jgi:hypothetical protein
VAGDTPVAYLNRAVWRDPEESSAVVVDDAVLTAEEAEAGTKEAEATLVETGGQRVLFAALLLTAHTSAGDAGVVVRCRPGVAARCLPPQGSSAWWCPPSPWVERPMRQHHRLALGTRHYAAVVMAAGGPCSFRNEVRNPKPACRSSPLTPRVAGRAVRGFGRPPRRNQHAAAEERAGETDPANAAIPKTL